MSGLGATGPASSEAYEPLGLNSGPTGPQSQIELEKAESQRQAARRHAQLYGSPTNNTGSNNVVPFRRDPRLNADENAQMLKGLTEKETAATKEQNDQPGANPVTPNEQQPTANATQAAEKEHQERPTAIRPEFGKIPPEVKLLPNWVTWRYMPPKSHGQKWRKVPFQPNGKAASTTDHSTWCSFEEACAAYTRGGFDGIGFVFDGEIGPDGLCYCGVDFDACIENRKLRSLARSRIDRLKTYTEVSVSGTGIHCVARAKPLDRIVKFDGVEIYTRARYFTFTGLSYGVIKSAPAEITALVEEMRGKEAATKQQKQSARAGSKGTSDAEVADDLKNAKPAQVFAALAVSEESLTDGIKNSWFENLPPELKDEVVDHALGVIAKNTPLLELETHGGNNIEYYKLTTSVARSGAPRAEDIFVRHASTAKEADNEEELRQHFLRCRDGERPYAKEITIGTLLGLGKENGANFDQWKCQTNTLPASGIKFRDFTVKGKPRASLANAVIAIKALGIEIRQDLFHHRTIVKHNGTISTVREGFLTDDTTGAIRSLINNTCRLDCGDPHMLAAVKEIARDHAFDPILDYLDECQRKWDRKKRVGTWVINYMGVEDTPLNRAIGHLMLIASVRRARVPGCKFDQICVLEGAEGRDKSTAIRVLAGDENFSDQSVLNVSDREAQEQLEGIWLHESADLTGLRKAEVERVKAFASRQVDRARPAYGRVREDRPRRCTQWATTNDDAYLASQTGNRRFWSLKVGRIDIDALRRDGDQLWGEAATLEAAGVSLVLDPKLWPAAREEQEKRRIIDTWEDVIDNMPVSVTERDGPYGTKEAQIIYQSEGKELVSSADVLVYVLKVPTGRQHQDHGKRLAQAMDRCGWKAGRVSILGKQCRGYWRDPPAAVPRHWRDECPMYEKRIDDKNWTTGSLGSHYRKVNGVVVSVKIARSGGWYALRGDELLGQAGRVVWFSTPEATRNAVDNFAAGGNSWCWIACQK